MKLHNRLRESQRSVVVGTGGLTRAVGLISGRIVPGIIQILELLKGLKV